MLQLDIPDLSLCLVADLVFRRKVVPLEIMLSPPIGMLDMLHILPVKVLDWAVKGVLGFVDTVFSEV